MSINILTTVNSTVPTIKDINLGFLYSVVVNSSTIISLAAMYTKVPAQSDIKMPCTNKLAPTIAMPRATPMGEAIVKIVLIIMNFFRDSGIIAIATAKVSGSL